MFLSFASYVSPDGSVDHVAPARDEERQRHLQLRGAGVRLEVRLQHGAHHPVGAEADEVVQERQPHAWHL